jgi:hypothetical protein
MSRRSKQLLLVVFQKAPQRIAGGLFMSRFLLLKVHSMS